MDLKKGDKVKYTGGGGKSGMLGTVVQHHPGAAFADIQWEWGTTVQKDVHVTNLHKVAKMAFCRAKNEALLELAKVATTLEKNGLKKIAAEIDKVARAIEAEGEKPENMEPTLYNEMPEPDKKKPEKMTPTLQEDVKSAKAKAAAKAAAKRK